MEKPMIEVHDIKKKYRMGQIGGGTLTADLQSWWARVRKKEDPNAPLFMSNRLVGDTFMALNGVSFTVQKGEAVAIIGGNGAGKSTLLKILSRITAPTEGEIVLRGSVASMLEVGTGFNGEMTGRENVYMNGAILGMTKSEIAAKMDEIIDFSECGDFIDTPVKRYSSGMYVKLAFAVTAHLDSDIMILDEVLAVGDTKFQKKCLGKMNDAANEDGKTVLYVSHNMATVRQLCTRAIVLKDGKVVFDGDVEEGIAVYLDDGQNLQLKKVFAQPKEFPLTQRSAILSTELVSGKNGYFDAQDVIQVKVSWLNLHKLSKVKFRCMIYSGVDAVGTCFSEDISLDSEQIEIVHSLFLHVSTLIEGIYKADLYIGRYEGVCLENYAQQKSAIEFAIERNSNQFNIQWSKAIFGCAAYGKMDCNTEG